MRLQRRRLFRGHHRPTSHEGSRAGLATVEFAVIAPVLVGVFLGMLELGRAISVAETLSDATRIACRTAANTANADATVTADALSVLSDNSLDGSQATVAILINGTQASLATASEGDRITVRVSIPVSAITWVPSQYVSGSLTSETTMMRQR